MLLHVTKQLAAIYTGAACTLNGKPAKIVAGDRILGVPYCAKIVPFDPSLDGFECSWEFVNRIMEKGGDFS